METFLKEAQSLNPDPMHVKEVCFLCVQCMEVSPRFNHLEMEQFLNVSILGVTKIQSKHLYKSQCSEINYLLGNICSEEVPFNVQQYRILTDLDVRETFPQQNIVLK